MKLAVMIPTRGTIFTKAIRALLDCLKGFDYALFTTTHLSTDKARNTMLCKALQGDYSHFFFTDDDVVLPKGIIAELVKFSVACCDVPLKEGGGSVRYNPDGSVAWAGTGCLMVAREVIEKLTEPYFWLESTEGGEDINFCYKIIGAGYEIKVIPAKCRHLEIIKYADLYRGKKTVSRHKIKIHK